jgi:hypothetical protein
MKLTWEAHLAKYLLIESRDPFDSNDTRFCGDLARQLAVAKNEVTLFLVQMACCQCGRGHDRRI